MWVSLHLHIALNRVIRISLYWNIALFEYHLIRISLFRSIISHTFKNRSGKPSTTLIFHRVLKVFNKSVDLSERFRSLVNTACYSNIALFEYHCIWISLWVNIPLCEYRRFTRITLYLNIAMRISLLYLNIALFEYRVICISLYLIFVLFEYRIIPLIQISLSLKTACFERCW